VRWLPAFAAAVAVSLAGLVGCSAPSQAASAATCQHITGPFHTSHAAVYGAGGQRYIPYGINVVGLAHPLTVSQIRSQTAMTGTVDSDDAVIAASAADWCANTDRLQIQETYLMNPDGTVNRPFLAAIESEVAYAESLGLVVVLNDQTQLSPDHASKLFMPTRETYSFWDTLAYHFGHDPHVVFDLFNEPAFISTWGQWRNGGTLHGVRFFGMQQLASRLRVRDHAANLFWVEGPHVGGKLDQAWANRLTGVGPVEYAEHRPPGPHTAKDWYAMFGYLAAHNLAPVVEGEWADYARTNAGWACWNDAPRSVPVWLRYLANHHIGMIVTKMTPGQLIESANLDDPTHIRSNWSCTTGLNEGAGDQIRNWFSLHNG
jgi:hypothetical protein